MPGVDVTTSTRTGPSNPDTPPSARFHLVAQFERGPVGSPQRVRSLAEAELLYGGATSYSDGIDQLRTFFGEGGTDAYVVRLAGPGATYGAATLLNRAGLPALTLTALSPGTGSTDLTAVVVAGATADTVRVRILLDGAVVDSATGSAPADFSAAFAASAWVRATPAGATTVAPNHVLAVTTAPTAFTAGSDNRAAIGLPQIRDALTLLGPELGSGVMAVSGWPADLIGPDLIAAAKATRRLALLAPEQGLVEADLTAIADELVGPDGEYAGVFYPWVAVPSGGGNLKLISPEGFVAGRRARAHLEAGSWTVPAGERGIAAYVRGLEREVGREEANRLDESHVSVIRIIAGSVRLYGYRSLSPDVDNYRLLIGRDVLNTLHVAAESALEAYPFRTIDSGGRLAGEIKGTLVGLLDPIRGAGGLWPRRVNGAQVDPGYAVSVADQDEAALTAGTVAAVMALRVSPVGELIQLNIVKVGLSAAVA